MKSANPPTEPKPELALAERAPNAVEKSSAGQIGSMIDVIARAAADPHTDVAKMERLYAMLKEENARVAELQFNEAMAAAQAKMPMVIKKAVNPQTNSKYAKLETIAKAIAPVLEEYKISLKFSEGESPNPAKIRVACRVSIGGHSEDYHLDLSPDDKGLKGNDNKTRIHGEGSTFNYGRRYLTTMIFNLVIIGEDDDGNQGQRPRPAGPSSLRSDSTDVDALRRELWNVLVTVRGDKPNWDAANKWLWANEILDPANTDHVLPKISADLYRTTITKAKAKLGVK